MVSTVEGNKEKKFYNQSFTYDDILVPKRVKFLKVNKLDAGFCLSCIPISRNANSKN